MNKNEIKTGIEIETILNEDLNINLDNLTYFLVDSDGSLRKYNKFDYEEEFEFISVILKGKNEFFKGIEEFIKVFSKNGKYELNEVLDLNQSCGLHLHVGFNKRCYDFLDFYVLKQLRNKFFKEVRNSKVFNETQKENILNHYFRFYAKKSNYSNYLEFGERYKEFNVQSEKDNKGLEWRSLNILNCETWNDFKEFFRIVWDCIEFLYNKLYKGYKTLKRNLYKREMILNYINEKNRYVDVEKEKKEGMIKKINHTREINKNLNKKCVI